MVFCEPLFLFGFLPWTLLAYYAAPRSARNLVLCLASLLFYAIGEVNFLGWLCASVALNYAVARGLVSTRFAAHRKTLLALGVSSDLLILFIFKYSHFAIDNYNALAGLFHGTPLQVKHIVLPLGISFFTFHKISYKVDVYRGVAEVKGGLTDLCLYILLFPQLIAGPIIRYHDIAAELKERRETLDGFVSGVARFVMGMAKKILLADTFARVADNILGTPGPFAGIMPENLGFQTCALGTLCYTLQIYFDFSGYSDMAIGLGKMFGFRILENFNYPYAARSVTDFWRRWHISLSSWFRDYLYIPLGGNRCGRGRTYFNLLLVFFLCGLWHGASYNFVVWGLWHGALLVAERAGAGRMLKRMPQILQHLYVWLAVMLGWIVFRAETMQQAALLVGRCVGLSRARSPMNAALWLHPTLVVALVVGILLSVPWAPALLRWRHAMRQSKPWLCLIVDITGGAWLCACALAALAQRATVSYSPFIYYRF